MKTQVGIVGAGPAGLVLAHLLDRVGIASVVIENCSRDYVEGRIRAGVIEQWAAELLSETGIGGRMTREGLRHDGINFSFGGALHPINFDALIGKHITVYGQHEIIKDLIAARLERGGAILFDVDDVHLIDVASTQPKVRFQHRSGAHELACDFIGGCDGFHGVCRHCIPANTLRVFEQVYPYAWLGILAQSPPPAHELIYAHHDRGFALYSMRAATMSRLYVQCSPDDDVATWPDARVWDELHARLGGACGLAQGHVLHKGITGMRSFVAEPMQYGRLYLAGDAAHIVPPTGAKGMNLAIADVFMLSRALAEFYSSGRTAQLESYSQVCLRRIWKVQRFSWWMTQMLHRSSIDNAFEQRRQLAELDYVTSSKAAATALAENYVGLPVG